MWFWGKNAKDIMESKKDKHRNSGKSGQTRSLVSKISLSSLFTQ